MMIKKTTAEIAKIFFSRDNCYNDKDGKVWVDRDSLLAWIESYVKEYQNQVREEEGHNEFDKYSDSNKASVSAISLFALSIEKELKK